MPKLVVAGVEYELEPAADLPAANPWPVSAALNGKYRDQNGVLKNFCDLPNGTKITLELANGQIFHAVVDQSLIKDKSATPERR